MNKRLTGAALAVGALVLFGAALFLLRSGGNEQTETRGNVTSPPEAPTWTLNGQQAEPDYTSANATVTVSNATEAEKPAAIPVPADTPAPRVIEEDRVVTIGFLESAARTLAQGFIPARFSKSGSPATSLSFRSMNMRYGRSLEGFNVEGTDSIEARTALFRYLLTSNVAKSIFDDYKPVFVDTMEETARAATLASPDGESYTLTAPEVSDLFRVYASSFRSTSKAFRATADSYIAETVTRYIRAARSAERANAAFQTTLADYGPGAKEVTVAGSRLKGAVKERQRIKKLVLDAMRKQCRDCNNEDLFYIATWSYRRAMQSETSEEFLNTAADCLSSLADSFDARAAKLLEE